jgi:cytochrome o ubiquinol oxidase subunit 2
MKTVLKRLLVIAFVILFIFGTWALLRTGHYDVLETHGVIASQQRSLLIFTLLLSAIVVVPVFTMLGLFAWKYRDQTRSKKGHKAQYAPDWASNFVLETIWWGIPIAIIGVLAVIAWQTSHSLDPGRRLESSNRTIEVQVVALQWKWLFIYPDLGIATVNELPVPVDTPIHFTLTADAPMSAFWVPTLGTQIYAMSGMSSQLNLMADKTGDFPGYTTNINGAGYSDMKFTVHSRSATEFEAWTKEAKIAPKVLDAAEYRLLAAPSKIKEERVYRVAQTDLYDSVILKYMHAMDDEATVSTEGGQ